MTIKARESLLHWNYYLALDSDLMNVSRYIEFTGANFATYSIELAHILLASSSEVDVLAKAICHLLKPKRSAASITQYRQIITGSLNDFSHQVVQVPRFALTLQPWSNWADGASPDWWRAYNDVKHHRDEHFPDASLKNALNSLGALLIVNFHFYRLTSGLDMSPRGKKDTTRLLEPESQLIKFEDEYYFSHLIV
jgi:hypothetical protein